jgi:hypothetical protein
MGKLEAATSQVHESSVFKGLAMAGHFCFRSAAAPAQPYCHTCSSKHFDEYANERATETCVVCLFPRRRGTTCERDRILTERLIEWGTCAGRSGLAMWSLDAMIQLHQ